MPGPRREAEPVQLSLLVVSYLASAAVSTLVAGVAWRRRLVPGARELALLMAAVGWWLLANAVEAGATERSAKIAASVMAYPGIVSTSVLFLLFALRWTHQDAGLTRRRIGLLLVVPAISVAMAATNEWHHLLWPSITLVDAWGITAVYGHGPWFWIELAYGYTVAGAALVALIRALHRQPAFYSTRMRFAMVAASVPILASAGYAAGFDASIHADLSSVAFAITGLVAAWGILQSQTLDPVPVAWATLVDILPDAVLVLGPDGRLAALNPSASRMFEIDRSAVGRPVEEALRAFPGLVQVARITADSETEILADALRAPQAPGPRDVMSPSEGSWFDVRVRVIHDGRGRDLGRILVVRDVTERHRMVETIRQHSLTDELTGLLNRRGFMTLAGQQMRSSVRNRTRFWLLFADVDGLKEINDRLGHEAGDEALREIAHVLRTSVFRSADVVARFGGDEFAVVAAETGPAERDLLVNRIETALQKARETSALRFELSVSVGAAVFDPAHAVSLEELVREADRQMYATKRSRRNGGRLEQAG